LENVRIKYEFGFPFRAHRPEHVFYFIFYFD